MANTKISALTSATTPLAGTEVLPMVQSSTTVKVATNDLTVRNIRANATTGILQITGPTAATTRVVTVPDANFTAARTDAAQSFTGDQTLSTGNLVIGTAGKGIDFSATTHPAGMTSELLADYEEGTWTPVVVGWTGTTYASQNGNYTKIGNQVTAWFYLVFSGGSAAANVQITGLPYTIGSVATNGGAMTYYSAPLNETTGVLAYPGATTTAISLYQDNDSGAAVQSNGAAVGSYLVGFATYHV